MSLEQRIESLEVAIIKLTDVLSAAGLSTAGATDAGTDKTTSTAKGGKAGKATGTAKDTKTETKPESKYTLEQLKALLQDYKQIFGMPEAKKLLPGLGYENSNAVPADKIDEVYDHVDGLIKAKAEADAAAEDDSAL